jgi:DNA repair protein RecN (Recombination protein N)
MADHHFYISKETQAGKTRTQVNLLDFEGRTNELARMLGGAVLTQTTHQHATEMLRMAELVRKKV